MNKISTNLLALYIGFCFCSTTAAQTLSIDSMKRVLLTQKEDTNKAKTLYFLSEASFYAGSYKEGLQFAKNALALSEKIQFQKGKKFSYFYIMLNSFNINDYLTGINYSYPAINFYNKTKDTFLIGATFQILGGAYLSIEDTTEALNNLKKSLAIRESGTNKLAISQTYNSIGEVYCKQGKYEEALINHTQALNICKGKGFYDEGWGLAYTKQSIGTVFEKVGDAEMIKGNNINANIDYHKALDVYEEAYNAWDKAEMTDAIAEIDFLIGNIYLKLKNYAFADKKLKISLREYQLEGDKKLLGDLYLSLSKLDSVRGNYKSAYYYYKQYILQKEFFSSPHLIKKIESLKMKSEMDKKELQVELLTTQNKLHLGEAKRQQQNRNLIYISIVIMLLGIAYGFLSFKKTKQQQQLQAITEERLRISRELHDEIGATLSGISMYSHLAKEQIKNAQAEEINKSLNIMQQSSGDMVNKLNDIVWLLNPDQDTFQKLIQRLEEYAGEMTAVKNMKLQTLVPEQFLTKNLSVETRRNIYLFCKEAINNAVKYSDANLLELTIKENNNLLEIAISDDGKGFDVQTIKRGNGLTNMQKRANELGADFNIQSKMGSGCLISLKLKITQ